MCSLSGIIFGTAQRAPALRAALLHRFTRLLLYGERRGPRATGIASVRADGTFRLLKAPLPAHQFVLRPNYAAVLDGVDNDTTLLMGHTRWPTQGTEYVNANNHPLVVGTILLTHNGHLSNADAVAYHLGLLLRTDVDSEVIAQIAAQCTTSSGGMDITRLNAALGLLRGRMAAVLVSTADPTHIILVKGNQPLELAIHVDAQVVAYASQRWMLDAAFDGMDGWKPLQLQCNTFATMCTDEITCRDTLPMRFMK